MLYQKGMSPVLGGYVNYRGNTVIVVVMVMAGYPRYIRRRRSCRLGFLAGSGALAGIGVCPHGVQGGILAYFYAFSAMIACGRSILVGAPSLKIVVSSGGFLTIYCKGSFFCHFLPSVSEAIVIFAADNGNRPCPRHVFCKRHARQQAQHHDKYQRQCKLFFHIIPLLFNALNIFLLNLAFIISFWKQYQ